MEFEQYKLDKALETDEEEYAFRTLGPVEFVDNLRLRVWKVITSFEDVKHQCVLKYHDERDKYLESTKKERAKMEKHLKILELKKWP